MSPPDDSMRDERADLFAYYDAQADSYEEFYQGAGQAIGPLATEYPIDTAAISKLLASFGRGEVIDLACGTGFWLTAYGANCAGVTLVDQSADALAHCKRRVDSLGLQARTRIIRDDLFAIPVAATTYDACVLGFLLSHLTDRQTDALFDRVRTILRPQCELAVIDSAWTDARRPFRQRDGFDRRVLADGRAFTIRKKYYDRPELEALLLRHEFQVRSTYVGQVFLAVIATRVS